MAIEAAQTMFAFQDADLLVFDQKRFGAVLPFDCGVRPLLPWFRHFTPIAAMKMTHT